MNIPAPLPYTDSGWDVTKDIVRGRLDAMIALTGQATTPALTFDPARSSLPQLSPDASTPAAYHGILDDTVAVNLHRMFGAPDDKAIQSGRWDALLDGYLLHELGHRHDRWMMQWLKAPAIPVIVAIPTLALIAIGAFGGGERYLNTALAVWGVVFVVWVVALWPVLRWQERRADDYILDSGGGRGRCDAFMDSLEYLEKQGKVAVPLPVHASAEKRRDRQARRWRRLSGSA